MAMGAALNAAGSVGGSVGGFGGAGRQDDITSIVYIPATMVGLVIGAKGSVVNEIINKCDNQVFISVAKEDKNCTIDFVSEELMRPITVSGPGDLVYKAHQL